MSPRGELADVTEVKRLSLSPERAFYFVGETTFDEEDRDLSYIDHMIQTWQTWRDYVTANGEAA